MIPTTIVALALDLPSSTLLLFLLLIALAPLAPICLLLALDDQNSAFGCTPLHLRHIPLFVLFFEFLRPSGSTGSGPISTFVCFQSLGHHHSLLQVALDVGSNMLLQVRYKSR